MKKLQNIAGLVVLGAALLQGIATVAVGAVDKAVRTDRQENPGMA